jgi:hypothetical protein
MEKVEITGEHILINYNGNGTILVEGGPEFLVSITNDRIADCPGQMFFDWFLDKNKEN